MESSKYFLFVGPLTGDYIYYETEKTYGLVGIACVLDILKDYTQRFIQCGLLPHEALHPNVAIGWIELWRELWSAYKEEYFDTLIVGDE